LLTFISAIKKLKNFGSLGPLQDKGVKNSSKSFREFTSDWSRGFSLSFIRLDLLFLARATVTQ